MSAVPLPVDEDRRLAALRHYDLLDTLPDQALDDITALAAHICDTPIALISLVDEHRQWFKSKIGLSIVEVPRDASFCAHAILQPGLFVVPDTTKDDRFSHNPFVTGEPHIRYYGGAPLTTTDGQGIGSLCVLDVKPRQLNATQREALVVLSKQVMTHFECHLKTSKLIASELRSRAVAERSRQSIVIHRDGRIIYANPAASELYGASATGQLLGREILELVHPDCQEIVRPRRIADAAGGVRGPMEEVRLRKLDGTTIEAEITIAEVIWDGENAVELIATDISPRKEAEASKYESNRVLVRTAQRLRQALVTARMVWWEWNIKIGSLHIDPCGAPCILGYSVDQLAGMTFDRWLSWMPEEDRAEVHRTLALTLSGQNDEWVCEYRWRAQNGDYQWLRDIGRISLRDRDGKPLLMTGSTQEINRLHLESGRIKHLEYQLMQSQKMETLGQFSGGIAHDFNNLLTGISGSVQLARMESPAVNRVGGYLDIAEQGCSRARELVKRLLDFARMRTTSHPKDVQLDRLVRDIAPLIKASLPENISLELDLDVCPTLMADEGQILQLILNLSINGSHAIGAVAGTISIKLKNLCSERELTARSVVLSVTDTGRGMDEQTRAKIFEPFYTTKPIGAGTGLGLAVVLGVVKEHGGTITCESTLGRGTTFQVVLPITGSAGDEEVVTPPVSIAGTRITGKTILVVDDEPVISALLATSLRLEGQTVEAFTSPGEAIEKLRECPGRYDLLITDFMMPEMNGVALIRAARELRSNLPVLLISGDFGRVRPGEDLAKFDRLLLAEKPLNLENFRALVQALLIGADNVEPVS